MTSTTLPCVLYFGALSSRPFVIPTSWYASLLYNLCYMKMLLQTLKVITINWASGNTINV